MTLFLCGDVMTGRGIDQVLPHPNPPRIHEPHVVDAREYVALAERANGALPKPVAWDYPWGDALAWLRRVRPGARIANLETSVTRSEDWEPKGINYRMHPDNLPVLDPPAFDACVLANNHVLDYGHAGLAETLARLKESGRRVAGAGLDRDEAFAPAVVEAPGGGRVLVLGLGDESSGIPSWWGAGEDRPGVALLPDLSEETARRVAARAGRIRRPGDLVVASIHWGGNWGYGIPEEQVRFAHRLLAEGVDLIHGHSSHHVRPIEVHDGRLVLYGCGDFLDDYEGIEGYESFRGDLALAFFPTLERATGRLLSLEMAPFRIRRFRLENASPEDARWLAETIGRVSRPFRFHPALDARGVLRWP